MSFFRRERSTSAPRNRDSSQTRFSRSQSFSVPNPKRHTVQISGGPTENASFHGKSDHQRENEDEQSIDDLNETIHSLQSTLVNHATSNAETMNNLNILQTAHDKLYAEHMSLQEQMDDAVELLKYLKVRGVMILLSPQEHLRERYNMPIFFLSIFLSPQFQLHFMQRVMY